jgi:hypothetical protein
MGSLWLPFFIGTNKMDKNQLKQIIREEVEKMAGDVAKREKVKSKLSPLATAQQKINTPDEAVAASVEDIEDNLSNIPDNAKNRVLARIINKLRKAAK